MITFQSFLQSIRKQKHVDLDTLGMGICSVSFLSRVENGDRKAPYLLRECLMGRLGVSGENFYEYLQPKEYEAWRLRQEIVRNFLFGKNEEAQKNIEKYGKLSDEKDAISKQFYLYVSAEAMINAGGAVKDALPLYREAVDCSMSHLTGDFEKNFDSALLSIQEYCVLVKYIFAELSAAGESDTGRARMFLSRLCAIMDKVERDTLDTDIISKIYSMAVAYFYKGVRKFFASDETMAVEEKDRCFKAIGFLRESRKTYFLTDIMAALMSNNHLCDKEKALREELASYYGVIKRIYTAQKLSIEACNSNTAYALVESGAYAIGDVLLRRRKMLKLSQKDICEDICTEKTMARMENGKCAVQDVIFKNLCEKLKLVPDYVHGEIVYDELNTYDIYRRVKTADNGNDIDELRDNLVKLKDKMNLDVLSNRQCYERAFNNLKRKAEGVSDDEYCENLRTLLNLTVGNIDEIDTKIVFFTDAEMMLLHNLALRQTPLKKKYLKLIISEISDESGDIKLLMHYRINAFLLSYYASELGNEDLYDVSDAISNRILETGLRANHLSYISDNIYNKYWNAKQSGEEKSENLTHCIALSRFVNNQRDVDFYTSKVSEKY